MMRMIIMTSIMMMMMMMMTTAFAIESVYAFIEIDQIQVFIKLSSFRKRCSAEPQ